MKEKERGKTTDDDDDDHDDEREILNGLKSVEVDKWVDVKGDVVGNETGRMWDGQSE